MRRPTSIQELISSEFPWKLPHLWKLLPSSVTKSSFHFWPTTAICGVQCGNDTEKRLVHHGCSRLFAHTTRCIIEIYSIKGEPTWNETSITTTKIQAVCIVISNQSSATAKIMPPMLVSYIIQEVNEDKTQWAKKITLHNSQPSCWRSKT